MKLTELLIEGEIKIPEKQYEILSDTFVYWYMSYFQNFVESQLKDKEYEKAKNWVKAVCNKYNVPIPSKDDVETAGNETFQQFKIDFQASDWPYTDKLKKFYPDISSLNGSLAYRIYFKTDTKVIGKGTLAAYRDRKIIISIPNHYMDETYLSRGDSKRRAILTRDLERALGSLRHELAHAVQFEILSKLHHDQVQSINDIEIGELSSEERTDLYLLSQVEFDPQIKSIAKLFQGVELYSKSQLQKYDRKKALEYVTGASTKDLTPEEISQIGFNKPNKFFVTLKKKDPTRWKKAVKIFYQLIGE